MNSMCLGMVADFDERAGDFPAAINALEAAIATNEELLGGFTGALQARLGWVLLQNGELARAEVAYQRALDSGRHVQHTVVVFGALTGFAALHRIHGRNDAAVAAAEEAMEIYRAGGPRRFRNRVDHLADLYTAASVCCVVLAVTAAESGDPERAATLFGQAERLRAEAEVEVLAFQRDDAETAQETAVAALGEVAFAAAFERGRSADQVVPAG
jgi:tetratricopeptide (TPR) repeat protein